MPQVGNKKFAYTPQGIAQANQAMKRRQFGAALNQLRGQNKVYGGPNQVSARPANQRRPLPVKGTPPAPSDKMYRPEYGPKGTPMDQAPPSRSDKMYRPEYGPKNPTRRIATKVPGNQSRTRVQTIKGVVGGRPGMNPNRRTY